MDILLIESCACLDASADILGRIKGGKQIHIAFDAQSHPNGKVLFFRPKVSVKLVHFVMAHLPLPHSPLVCHSTVGEKH